MLEMDIVENIPMLITESCVDELKLERKGNGMHTKRERTPKKVCDPAQTSSRSSHDLNLPSTRKYTL